MSPRTNAAGAKSAFPNAEESLALQASLLSGERAAEAWKKLSAASTAQKFGIAWIAPLLMSNLVKIAPTDPWVTGNPHFLTLCHLKTRAIVSGATAVLLLLESADIKTLALKGLALGATVYDAPGLRTVSDLDILVPTKDAFRAIDVLKKASLRAGRGEPRLPADLRDHHAHAFYPTMSHALSLDLHWHVLASARGDDDDLPFWAEAQPISLAGQKTLALCPEDQLLHVLVHGVRWTRMPHVRWVADAALILRRTGEQFRTERFLEGLDRFDAVTPAREGLRFLVDLLGEGEDLYDRVRSLKRSRFSQLAFKARATAYETRTVADRIALRIESAVWTRRARRRSAAGRN